MNANEILKRPRTNPKHQPVSRASIEKLIEALRSKLTPDLLKPEYQDDKRHPMFGHCFVATEALWHLTYKTLDVYCGKDEEGITHWWLCDKLGHIYDPTGDQYTDLGKTPPYTNGKRNGFMTTYKGGSPSARAQELIERISNA